MSRESDALLLQMFQGFRDIGENVNPVEALHEMQTLVRVAKHNPGAARDIRAESRHHRKVRVKSDEYFDKYRSFIGRLSRKYGYRSLTFQTMLEAVSCVTLTYSKVTEKYKRHPLPPAFDPSKRSPLSESSSQEGQAIRDEIFQWVEITDDPVILQIKDCLKCYKPEWKDPEKRDFYSTSNGSSSGIMLNGVPLLDIEAQCVRFPGLEDEFPYLCRWFGIRNDTSGDQYQYIWIDNPWAGASGVHTVVPDKDGKSREVYFMAPYYQAIGKGIAKTLEPKMRRIDGIYTYRQKDWVQLVLDNHWDTTRTIITIDMEKFSDTIVRKYLLELLVHLGLSPYVAQDMDRLYGLPVYDRVLEVNLGPHDVVMQGHYGIFPIMSLLNLVIQRFINYKYNVVLMGEPIQSTRLYSAVLGDDTGMVFNPNIRPSIVMPMIKSYYGAFGMRINELKSDSIYKGIGQADFAKIHFDSQGVLDHMNPKNIQNLNIDGVIKDILGTHIDQDKKRVMLATMFGEMAADSILHLHVINGGPSDHVISDRDINYYVSNLMRVNLVLQEEKRSDEERALRVLAHAYRDQGFSLQDSPLVEYLDPEDILPNDLDLADDMIMSRVLKAQRIGSDINQSVLRQAVGYTWQEIEEGYLRFKHTNPNHVLVRIHDEFSKFDSFAAKRKMGQKGRFSSVFTPCITGNVEVMYSNQFDIDQLKSVTSVSSLTEYYEKIGEYRSTDVRSKLESVGLRFFSRYYGTKPCCWLLDPDHPGQRLCAVHSLTADYLPYSVKGRMTQEVFNSTVKPRLKKLNMDVSMDRFRSLIMRMEFPRSFSTQSNQMVDGLIGPS